MLFWASFSNPVDAQGQEKTDFLPVLGGISIFLSFLWSITVFKRILCTLSCSPEMRQSFVWGRRRLCFANKRGYLLFVFLFILCEMGESIFRQTVSWEPPPQSLGEARDKLQSYFEGCKDSPGDQQERHGLRAGRKASDRNLSASIHRTSFVSFIFFSLCGEMKSFQHQLLLSFSILKSRGRRVQDDALKQTCHPRKEPLFPSQIRCPESLLIGFT